MKYVTRDDPKKWENISVRFEMATIRVKPRSSNIGKQHECERDKARKRERGMCSEKDYDTERRFVRGKWISRPLRCVHRGNFYWFSVRSDSQRSFRTHTSPSPLNPIFSSYDHPSIYHPFRDSKSFLLLFIDISIEMLPCIMVTLSSVSYFWSSSFFLPLLFSLRFYNVLPFYFPTMLDSAREGRKPLQNSRNEYQINEFVSVNFNFLCLSAEPYLAF